MALVYSAGHLSLIRTELDHVFLEHFDYGPLNKSSRSVSDPFKVTVSKSGDYCVIRAGQFKEEILMKNTIWDYVFGGSWEERVRNAQRNVFEQNYRSIMVEEKKDYEVSRLK